MIYIYLFIYFFSLLIHFYRHLGDVIMKRESRSWQRLDGTKQQWLFDSPGKAKGKGKGKGWASEPS
jgi:hypothetical protein